MSWPQYGRIERGRSPEVSVATIATTAAVLGLDTSVRFFPTGDPVRDAGHVALLERFRTRLHETLTWRTEVAFPRTGDLRAWDEVSPGWQARPGMAHQMTRWDVTRRTAHAARPMLHGPCRTDPRVRARCGPRAVDRSYSR